MVTSSKTGSSIRQRISVATQPKLITFLEDQRMNRFIVRFLWRNLELSVCNVFNRQLWILRSTSKLATNSENNHTAPLQLFLAPGHWLRNRVWDTVHVWVKQGVLLDSQRLLLPAYKELEPDLGQSKAKERRRSSENVLEINPSLNLLQHHYDATANLTFLTTVYFRPT